MKILYKWLPHHSSRDNHDISAIILHYPAPNPIFKDPYCTEAIYELLLKHELSYHYYVQKDGTIYQFVKDEDKAWHAGISSLHGKAGCNYYSLGICLENNGGQLYHDAQLVSLGKLCKMKSKVYNIPHHKIVGHEHVSPKRKKDPGRLFPWYEFFTVYMQSF